MALPIDNSEGNPMKSTKKHESFEECPRCGAEVIQIPANISDVGPLKPKFYVCKKCGYTKGPESGEEKKRFEEAVKNLKKVEGK
jgi:predicted RNA-binding Zn-ribbon protein involved in translation (DUF1610 family)